MAEKGILDFISWVAGDEAKRNALRQNILAADTPEKKIALANSDLGYFSGDKADAAAQQIMALRDEGYKEQAAKSLADFAQTAPDKYRELTGTDDPRFLDGESLGVLQKSGFLPANYNSNPLVYNGLGDFAKDYKRNYSTRRILGDDLANMVPDGNVDSLVKLAGLAKGEAPKRYEVGGALVDADGNVIYQQSKPESDKWIDWGYGQKKNIIDGRIEKVPVAPRSENNIFVNGSREAKSEQALRKEFLGLPEVKDFPTVETQIGRARKVLDVQTNSNMPVDQTIITVFNKMLDPSSVVRESEYARTPQDLALLSRIKGKWDKVQSGGAGLTLEERQAMLRMVENFGAIASEQYNARADEYRTLADSYGMKPERVVVRHNALDKPQASNVAPAGTKAKLKDGRIVTSDGKGGWN